MFRKNKTSGLLALAAAGGLWAWQNRDKVKRFVEEQRNQLNQAQSRQYEHNAPATGETRRISQDELNNGTFTNEPRTTYDPSI